MTGTARIGAESMARPTKEPGGSAQVSAGPLVACTTRASASTLAWAVRTRPRRALLDREHRTMSPAQQATRETAEVLSGQRPALWPPSTWRISPVTNGAFSR